MKTIIFCILSLLSTVVIANPGMYCKNKNYMAYEQFKSDPYHIHVVNLESNTPQVKHIKLPYKVTNKLGMNCLENKIELRGKFHFVRIDIADFDKPKISKRRLTAKDKRVKLPEHSFYEADKLNHDPISVLESGYSYHLNVHRSQTSEVYPTGATLVHHIKTELLKLDPDGNVENRKLLFTDVVWEPLD